MSFELVGVRLVAENEAGFNRAIDGADKAVRGFGDTADKTFKQLPGLSDIAVGALHKVGEVAIDVFMQAGQAAVGFIGDSISAAGDFESGMNRFAAVAGGALEESGLALEDFRDQFIQIGKELPVSTSEVQDAAIEMIKGGIEPATVAAGGLKQVIQFAAAADLDLAEASTIAAKALGGWVDQAASADEKAQFLAHSTDLLQKAANASTVDVDELALGLYNVQGTAKLAGVSFDETVTALAQLAPAFSSSADAGTSFKAFLGRLQPTTKPAIAAMKDLGLYTDEAGSVFYDAQGNFIGMEAVAGKLKAATEGLSEAQRVQALQTIFGQDAIRVAAVLSEQGADGYNNMADALAKQNSVAEMAAQKQAGFNTALDNFKGSVEALQITIGTKLLPVLTELFNTYLAPGVNILTDLIGKGQITAETFAGLAPPLQNIVKLFQDLFSINPSVELINFFYRVLPPELAGQLTDGFLKIRDSISKVFDIFSDDSGFAAKAVNTFYAILPPDLAEKATELFMGVRAAFDESGIPGVIQVMIDKFAEISPGFALIKGAAEAALPAIKQIVTDVFGFVTKFIEENGASMLADVQGVWDKIWGIVSAILPPIQKIISTVFGAIAQFIHEHGDDIMAFLKRTWDQIFEVINLALDLIKAVVVPILTFIANFIAAHGQEIQTLLANTWKAITAIIDGALTLIKGILKTALQIVQGDWEGAWNTIKETVSRLWEDITQIIDAAIGNAKVLFGGLVDWVKGIPKMLEGVGEAIVNAIWDGIKAQWDKLADWFTDKLNDLKSQLPFSEPKDPNSPLRGLPKSGRAIVDMLQIGIDKAGPLQAPGLASLPASPMALMAAGNTTNATYNQPRTVNLNYNTTHAPPASQSLAMANALV